VVTPPQGVWQNHW